MQKNKKIYKIAGLSFLIIISFLFFTRILFADNPVDISSQSKITYTANYKLLAPLGKDYTEVDTNNIGDYFNKFFKIAIGLAGALAVIMIVIGGVQWMGSESIFGKTAGKERVTSAVLGLLIALGSYALLNTLNPALLGKNGLFIAPVTINLPDVGDGTIDPNFKNGKGSYSSSVAESNGVKKAVLKLKQGWEINRLVVSSSTNKMIISLKKKKEVDKTIYSTSILPGTKGYAEKGAGKEGDRKTPKGTWKILNIATPANSKPVYSKSGSNMGASFWLLNPTTDGERGIGFHGSESGALRKTYGCIRMTNSDILALLPYIKVGTVVVIK